MGMSTNFNGSWSTKGAYEPIQGGQRDRRNAVAQSQIDNTTAYGKSVDLQAQQYGDTQKLQQDWMKRLQGTHSNPTGGGSKPKTKVMGSKGNYNDKPNPYVPSVMMGSGTGQSPLQQTAQAPITGFNSSFDVFGSTQAPMTGFNPSFDVFGSTDVDSFQSPNFQILK